MTRVGGHAAMECVRASVCRDTFLVRRVVSWTIPSLPLRGANQIIVQQIPHVTIRRFIYRVSVQALELFDVLF